MMNMYQKREQRKNNKSGDNKSLHSATINWYPGHMAKTKRLIIENLNLIDIIYEVIDARIPYSSKVRDIDKITKDKPHILIMTKYDLCDKIETEKYKKYYENLGYSVLTYDLINGEKLEELFNLSRKLLKDKYKKMSDKGDVRKTIRALVIGIPNVGKSTLINKISGKKSALTGNKPGVTKEIRWIKASDDILLLDSPGILWPKLDPKMIAFNLASMTAIKEEILNKQDITIYILETLYKYYPSILEKYYGVTDITDFISVFDVIGKKCGCLQKGGITDDNKVMDIVINDIKNGKIKGITFDRLN